jgi:hypothetical protein
MVATFSRKSLTFLIPVSMIFLAVSGFLLPGAFAQGPPDGVPPAATVSPELEALARNSFIFLFKDSVPREAVRGHAQDLAARHGGQVDHVYETALRGFAATIPPQAADRLARDPRIAYYEPDGIAHAIGRPDATRKPVNVPSPPQVVDWGITRVCAPSTTGLCPDPGSGRTAWIIDTGIDLDHPDLNVGVGRSRSFVRTKTTPDDGNGHGTHVAGIIAAKNNGTYTIGVAAGAEVVAVRVLDRGGSGLWSWVIAGVNYVAQNAATTDVANMSLGGSYNLSVNAAVTNASEKCPFTVAAGNESDDASNHSPASASTSNADKVYTISATNSSDGFAWFSNWGNPPVDFAAPGVSILSLWKGGGTKTLSGTSMAAPHVAGLLLLGPVGCDGSATGDTESPADHIAHYKDGTNFTCPSPLYKIEIP